MNSIKALQLTFKAFWINLKKLLASVKTSRTKREGVTEVGEPYLVHIFILQFGFSSLKTAWEYSDRPGNRFPTLSWNSEHLAVWLGKSSVVSGRQFNGCDVDVETWQVKLPLLGYHYYTD